MARRLLNYVPMLHPSRFAFIFLSLVVGCLDAPDAPSTPRPTQVDPYAQETVVIPPTPRSKPLRQIEPAPERVPSTEPERREAKRSKWAEYRPQILEALAEYYQLFRYEPNANVTVQVDVLGDDGNVVEEQPDIEATHADAQTWINGVSAMLRSHPDNGLLKVPGFGDKVDGYLVQKRDAPFAVHVDPGHMWNRRDKPPQNPQYPFIDVTLRTDELTPEVRRFIARHVENWNIPEGPVVRIHFEIDRLIDFEFD